MPDQMDCMYCSKDERLQALMYEVTQTQDMTLYLYREDTYHGRCILVPKRHVRTFIELEDDERRSFMDQTAKVAKVLDELFSPAQINYLMLGDLAAHLHVHIVPKYKDGADFGSMFRMMPEERRMLSDEQCEEIAVRIRERL